MRDKSFFTGEGSLLGAEKLYRLFLAVLYAMIIYVFLGPYIRLGEYRFGHVAAILITVLSIGFLCGAEGRRKLPVLAVILSVLILVGSIAEWKNVRLIFLNFPRWIMTGEAEEPLIAKGSEIIVCVVLAALSFLMAFLMYKRTAAKAVFAGLLAAGLTASMIMGIDVPHLASVLIFLTVFMSVAELIRKHWNKQKKGTVMRCLMYLMPVFLLYGILVFAMPVYEKPYDWDVFRKAYRAIEEGIRKFSQTMVLNRGKGYVFAYSGFSEDAGFSGSVRSSEVDNLSVSVRYGHSTPLYLTGAVMDSFDGKEWENTCTELFDDYRLDAFETYLAVASYDPTYIPDYLSSCEVDIRYLYLKTNAIFIPQKCASLNMREAGVIDGNAGGSYTFEKRKGYGTEYSLKCYEFNLGSSAFAELMKTVPELPDDETIHAAYRRFSSNENEITAEMILQHRNEIMRNYRNRPFISNALHEYIENAASGTKPGTLERLQKLEALLSSYTYDTSPGRLPSDIKDASDFLDYFMLESRKGYCSYFATAFVLLAREEGFPARYVQGFMVPASRPGQQIVTSTMSHAWPEVYLEGIGWIPFEPTPGFGDYRYAGWKTTARGDDKESSGQTDTGMPDISDLMEEYKNEIDPELLKPSEEEDAFNPEELLRILRAVGLAFSFLLAFLVILILAERLMRRIVLKSMKPERRYRAEAGQLLGLLGLLGASRKEAETLNDQRLRAKALLDDEKTGVSEAESAEALAFIPDYEALQYGGFFDGSGAFRRLSDSAVRILAILKKRSFARWLFWRIIYDRPGT